MKSLFLNESLGEFTTPNISFDLESKIFEIGGESFLEDTDEFYAPILDWLNEFKENYQVPIVFNFKFIYYNSSSSKSIMRIMKILKEYQLKSQIDIYWFYPEDNPDLMQEGEDFRDALDIEIQLQAME